MRNYSEYDNEVFDKVLLKIKSLLDQKTLDAIPGFDVKENKCMELYNENVRISIEMITPSLG